MAGNHKIFYAGRPIGSVSILAKTLDYSEPHLLKIAADSAAYYTEFDKTVKEKVRTLVEAHTFLKILQKRIISRIFGHIQFPHYLHGGIKSTDPKDFISNALAHAKSEIAISVDIRNFFPSITTQQVENVFRYLFKFPPDVSQLLAKIITLHGHVPQGASTSSYIANLVMFEKEYKLAAKFEGQGFVYTRLIDDITVSSTKPLSSERTTKIISDVVKLVNSYGYKAHPKKTNVYHRNNPEKLMVVTGLWLNRRAPRVKKQQRKDIAYEVMQVKGEANQAGGRNLDEFHRKYNKASGKVAFLERLKHTEASRLRAILEPIKPTYDDSRIDKIKKRITIFGRRSHDQTKFGYLKRFYLLQHHVAIVKRTHPKLARSLQRTLNLKRPKTRLNDLYE